MDAVRDGEGKTPLAVAVRRFRTTFTQPRGAEADAAEEGASRVVALLLERGSSVAAVDAAGESVLHVAAEWAPASCLARMLGSASCWHVRPGVSLLYARGLRAPASCALCVPAAQGCLPPRLTVVRTPCTVARPGPVPRRSRAAACPSA